MDWGRGMQGEGKSTEGLRVMTLGRDTGNRAQAFVGHGGSVRDAHIFWG